MRLQRVAPLGTQRVLMKDVLVRWIHDGRLDLRHGRQRLRVVRGVLAALGRPPREVRQLGEQDRSLKGVEPRVGADLVVMVLLGTAVQSQLPEPIGCRIVRRDRKSTRLNSSHITISYAVFCLKKKK